MGAQSYQIKQTPSSPSMAPSTAASPRSTPVVGPTFPFLILFWTQVRTHTPHLLRPADLARRRSLLENSLQTRPNPHFLFTPNSSDPFPSRNHYYPAKGTSHETRPKKPIGTPSSFCNDHGTGELLRKTCNCFTCMKDHGNISPTVHVARL